MNACDLDGGSSRRSYLYSLVFVILAAYLFRGYLWNLDETGVALSEVQNDG